jgi:hypothetical protein
MVSGKKGIKKIKVTLSIDLKIINSINFLNKQGYKINKSMICEKALKEYIEDGKY